MAGFGELAAFGTSIGWSVSDYVHSLIGQMVGPKSVALLRLPYQIAFLAVLCLILKVDTPLEPGSVFYLFLSGVAGVSLCDFILYQAIAIVGPQTAVRLLSLSSCFTALLGFLFLGEVLSLQAVAGHRLVHGGGDRCARKPESVLALAWRLFFQRRGHVAFQHRHRAGPGRSGRNDNRAAADPDRRMGRHLVPPPAVMACGQRHHCRLLRHGDGLFAVDGKMPPAVGGKGRKLFQTFPPLLSGSPIPSFKTFQFGGCSGGGIFHCPAETRLPDGCVSGE